jgi:hypothetical protein
MERDTSLYEALDTLGAALVRKLPWMHLLAGATNQDEAEGNR